MDLEEPEVVEVETPEGYNVEVLGSVKSLKDSNPYPITEGKYRQQFEEVLDNPVFLTETAHHFPGIQTGGESLNDNIDGARYMDENRWEFERYVVDEAAESHDTLYGPDLINDVDVGASILAVIGGSSFSAASYYLRNRDNEENEELTRRDFLRRGGEAMGVGTAAWGFDGINKTFRDNIQWRDSYMAEGVLQALENEEKSNAGILVGLKHVERVKHFLENPDERKSEIKGYGWRPFRNEEMAEWRQRDGDWVLEGTHDLGYSIFD